MIQADGQAYYGYSTWLSLESDPSYYWFSGHLGQYIIVIPEYDMVVVKLGESRETISAETNFRQIELPNLVKETIKNIP